MKIHTICVAYERPKELKILIGSFLVQTSKNWVLHIVYDGPPPQDIIDVVAPYVNKESSDYDERVNFYQSPERYQNYGHPNRRTMLETIPVNPGDFILMTNDDNYYVPVFIKKMTEACKKGVGIVYCDTVHSHADYDVHVSQLRENGIDMGAFIVRADVARSTGFNYDHFSADGVYAEECLQTCIRRKLLAIKIKKPLFIHN